MRRVEQEIRREAKRQGHPFITERAKAAGMAADCIEDNDCLTLHGRVSSVVNGMRSGTTCGPHFFECKTYRWKEHVGPGEDYHLGYRTPAESARWIEHDQVRKLATLVEPTARKVIEDEVEAEVKAAFAFAEASPFPGPQELMTDIFYQPQEVCGRERFAA